MSSKQKRASADPSKKDRSEDMTDEEIHELEISGGVEGGMKAGSAGGPSSDTDRGKRKSGKQENSA
jgi:hypothetical protein